jgi:hypothetical protein
MPTLTVRLNGTDENPFHRFGLSQNPFPQLARYETDRAVQRLQALGGDPIPDVAYIRPWLTGYFSDEFIDGCVARFKKGEMVEFDVSWED